MGRGGNGSHGVLDVVLAQWPSTIFVPAVMVVIAVLVAVTRRWDERDAAQLAERRARESGRAVRARPRAASSSRRRWWGRTRCTCSWHTMSAEGASAPSGRRG